MTKSRYLWPRVMGLMNRLGRKLGRILVAGGALLLGTQLYGLFTGPVPFQDAYPNESIVIPGYHTRTQSYAEAQNSFRNLQQSSQSDRSRLKSLLSIVYGSFFHSPKNYDIAFYDNWIYWLYDQNAKLTYPGSYVPVMDASLLWHKGGGWCGQATQVFSHLAEELHFKTRHLWNADHAIAEVYLPGEGWRAVDADYGIFWDASFKSLQTKRIDELSAPLISKGWPSDHAELVARIYKEPRKPWIAVTAKRNILAELEQQTEILSYIIPVVMCFLGFLLFSLTDRISTKQTSLTASSSTARS